MIVIERLDLQEITSDLKLAQTGNQLYGL